MYQDDGNILDYDLLLESNPSFFDSRDIKTPDKIIQTRSSPMLRQIPKSIQAPKRKYTRRNPGDGEKLVKKTRISLTRTKERVSLLEDDLVNIDEKNERKCHSSKIVLKKGKGKRENPLIVDAPLKAASRFNPIVRTRSAKRNNPILAQEIPVIVPEIPSLDTTIQSIPENDKKECKCDSPINAPVTTSSISLNSEHIITIKAQIHNPLYEKASLKIPAKWQNFSHVVLSFYGSIHKVNRSFYIDPCL
jgi:hypothetical protein